MSIDVAGRHRFGSFAIDAAFSAGAGLTALFGRSGAGKTTVVNAVAGLLRPEQGRVAVDGQILLDTGRGIAVPPHRRRIGYVFQEGRLFPHLSVRRNLGFGRWFTGRRHRFGSFADTVELLGIGHLLERRPGGLSGGEKQRVAIGRALLASPRLLLMDEPLASLDEARKAEILPYIERLRDALGLPILYVSHSVPEIARLATTVVVLADGRVERHGPPAALMADPDLFPLMGRHEGGALLAARIHAHDPIDELTELEVSGGRLWVPQVEAPVDTQLRVRIRARDVILAEAPPVGLSALNCLAATVVEIGPLDQPIVDVQLLSGDDFILARITRRSLRVLAIEPGRPVYALLKSIAVGRRDIGRDEHAAEGPPERG
ncbi:MAG: molybdenum ABC transporter ATP-binding protein [Geminicoccaceae bacterium]